MEVMGPLPLSDKIWEATIPKGIKPPSFPKFDGCSGPYEHVASINTQMTIIKAPESLKCKLLSNTFKDDALRWYMGLPWAFLISYQEFVKKHIHQFSAIHYKKMLTTNLFNIQQGPS